MKNIIEVIKANKKSIVKKALIVGGTVAGLALVAVTVKKPEDEELNEVLLQAEETEEEENSDN